MPAGSARPCLPVFALAVILAGSACASVPRVNTAAPLPHYPPGRFTDLLSRELAHVAATPDTRAHVAFGQAFRLVQANGYSVRGNGPYRPLISFGWVSLNAPTDKLSTRIGFQPELADTALTAGDSGRLAARLTGRFDVDQIGTKLRALGARPDHGTWRLRPDHEADNTDPLGRRFPALADQVNLIHAAPHEVAYGPSAASIATMRATSHTLADDPAIRAVAACLDDPLVATITDEGLTPITGPQRTPWASASAAAPVRVAPKSSAAPPAPPLRPGAWPQRGCGRSGRGLRSHAHRGGRGRRCPGCTLRAGDRGEALVGDGSDQRVVQAGGDRADRRVVGERMGGGAHRGDARRRGAVGDLVWRGVDQVHLVGECGEAAAERVGVVRFVVGA